VPGERGLARRPDGREQRACEVDGSLLQREGPVDACQGGGMQAEDDAADAVGGEAGHAGTP